MPILSPTWRIILPHIFNTFLPWIFIFPLIRLAESKLQHLIPLWLCAVIYIASIPLFVTVKIWNKNRKTHIKAARLGATLPPTWKGKSIGSVDVLKYLADCFKNGYLGDGIREKLDEDNGLMNLRVLWDDTYFTSDINIMKALLATDFNHYVKGDTLQAVLHSVLGTGVFNSDGDIFHRSMTRPFFSRERISHLELFDKKAEETIAKMKQRMSAGYSIDFQDLISRFTLDAATDFLFGQCVNSLSADLPYPPGNLPIPAARTVHESDELANAILQAQYVLAERLRLGWIWPYLEMFGDKSKKPMKVVDNFLKPIIENALEREKNRTNEMAEQSKTGQKVDEVDDDVTLLDHLVRYTSDPVVLHDETLNIMIAGRDTTAGSLSFAIYFLCMYPDVCKRLRKEVLDTIGPDRRPSLEDIREMKYLRAVINETLRLYPAVPFNVRFATEDTLLPNPDPNGKPIFVPAQTPVSYSVLLMHRRKDYWGPDADEFDPSRFLDSRLQKYLTPNPFIFLPFNAGPRICLGQQFAYNEMSFFLIKLMQNFSSMELDTLVQKAPPASWAGMPGRKGVEKVLIRAHLTAYFDGGLWVKMQEASDGN
ncbi:cytochrome P450 monooxygenase pc-2 [Abortiporus biennis]|nr:cytochrome P450 monooxygenase pc-2 [Abortiporus biennis]